MLAAYPDPSSGLGAGHDDAGTGRGQTPTSRRPAEKDRTDPCPRTLRQGGSRPSVDGLPRTNPAAFPETLGPERLYVETIFSKAVDEVTYPSWYSGQGGAPQTRGSRPTGWKSDTWRPGVSASTHQRGPTAPGPHASRLTSR